MSSGEMSPARNWTIGCRRKKKSRPPWKSTGNGIRAETVYLRHKPQPNDQRKDFNAEARSRGERLAPFRVQFESSSSTYRLHRRGFAIVGERSGSTAPVSHRPESGLGRKENARPHSP